MVKVALSGVCRPDLGPKKPNFETEKDVKGLHWIIRRNLIRGLWRPISEFFGIIRG